MPNPSDLLDQVQDTSPAPPVVNSTADLLTTDDSGPARESVRLSKNIPPEQAAKVLQLKNKTGLPVDLVSRNADALKVQTDNEPITPEFSQDHPVVTSYIGEDPHHASLTAPDVSTWGAIERQFGFMKNQAERGTIDTEGSVRKMLKGFGYIDRDNELRIQQIEKRLQYDYNKQAPGPISNVFGHVVESAPSMAAAIGVGALGTGLGIPAGIGTSAAWGAMEFGNAFQDFSTRKDAEGNPAMDEDTARGFALLSGVGQGALFALGGKALEEIPGLKMISGPGLRSLIASPTGLATLKTLAADIGKTGATMGGYSGLASLIHAASGHLAEMKSDGSLADASPAEVIARILPKEDLQAAVEAAKSGVLTGGVLGLAGGTMDVTTDYRNYRSSAHARELYHVNNYLRATRTAEGWKNIGTAIASTKMSQVSPEQVEHLVSRIAPSQEVFVPLEQWQSYWQSKKADPRLAFQEVTGNTRSYDEALKTGTDIQIPAAKYAATIAPSEHAEFFNQHLRSDPLAMSADEAQKSIGIRADIEKEQIDARKKIAEGIAPEPKKEVVLPPDTATKVGEDVSQQLEAAGFSKEEATQQAKLYEAGFRTMGQRSGVDPLELYQRYGLKIRGGSDVGEVVPPDQAGQRTIGQAPLAPEGKTPSSGELDRSVFPGPSDPSLQSITRHPEYFKVNQEATDIVKRYASERGIEPTADLGKKLFQELHDVLGSIRLAKPEDRLAKIREITAKYPTLEADFVALKDKVWMDATDGYFRNYLKNRGLEPMGEDLPVIKPTEEALEGEGKPYALFVGNQEGIGAMYNVYGEHPTLSSGRYNHSTVRRETLEKEGIPIVGKESRVPEGVVPEDTKLAQGGNKPIGQLRFGGNRQMNIDLLKGSNLSTFLHETGHFYLEMLGDLAHGPDAKPEIKADFQTVLEHFGLKSREELKTEHHESWARQFEAYLMEGRAPAAELKAPFARFRDWLTSVYQKVTSLGIKLAPRVKEVFDRMLATKEQILDAEQRQGMSPLFEDPASVGMSVEKAARYGDAIARAHAEAQDDIVRKITDQAMREKSTAWQAERAAIQKNVEQEAIQRPEYHALEVLRGDPGVKASSGIESFKLDRKDVAESDPTGSTKGYPVGIFSDRGGLSADEAATILGFNSGTEMLYALKTSPKLEDFIQQQTDAQMIERHPEPRSMFGRAGNLIDEAMDAVHNDQRSRVLRLELEHLASQDFAAFKGLVRALGRRIPTIKEVRDDAEATIGSKTTAETLPSLYQRAEATSSREAQEHFLRGDFDKAFEAKQAELRNHELFRAAKEAKERSDKDLAFAQKFDNDSARERIGKAGGTYLEQIDAIRNAFDFSRVTLKELGKRESLRDWVQEQTEAGFNPTVPPDLLDQAGKISWREMSNDKLHSTVDSMRNIAHLAGLKNKLLVSLKERTFDETKTAIVNAVKDHYKITPEQLAKPYDLHPDWITKIKGDLNTYGAWRTRMEPLFEQLGVHEELFEPMNKAEDFKTIKLRESVKTLNDIFSAYSKRERAQFGRLTYIPELEGSGLSPNLNKMEMIMSLLHGGNEGNMTELMRGYRMSESQLRGIWKHLEPRDVQLAQKIWDYVDSYWADISKQERELNGLPPEKVQGRPLDVALADGTTHHLEGGYFPLVYDKNVSWRTAALGQDAMAKDMFPSYVSNTATKHNWTQARIGGGGQAPSLKFSVLTNHIFDVIHDLAYRKPVIDVYKLINDPDVQAHIQAGAGKGVYSQLNPWVKRIAGDRQWDPLGPLEAIKKVRSNMTVAELGFKLTSAFNDVASIPPAIRELSVGYMARGFKAFANVPEAVKFMFGKSEFMKSRWEDAGDRDIHAAEAQFDLVNSNPGMISELKAMSPVELKTMWIAMRLVDMGLAGPIWHGAYFKGMEGKVKGVEAGNEPQAVSYADQLVRDTKGSGSAKDMAPIQTMGGQLGKLMSMFYSQLNVIDNQMLRGYREFRQDKDISKVAAVVLMNWFLPAVFAELASGRGPQKEQSWPGWAAYTIGTAPLQMMPLAREALSFFERDKYQISPVEEAISTILKTAKNVAMKNPLGDRITGEDSEWNKKDISDAVMTLGYLKGLPTRQLVQSSMRLHNWMSDEEPHENPLTGIISVVTGSKNDR